MRGNNRITIATIVLLGTLGTDLNPDAFIPNNFFRRRFKNLKKGDVRQDPSPSVSSDIQKKDQEDSIPTSTKLGLFRAPSSLAYATDSSYAETEQQEVPEKILGMYKQWCLHFDKPYSQSRFPIFKQNFLKLEDYYNKTGIAVDMNEYADMAPEEIFKNYDEEEKGKEEINCFDVAESGMRPKETNVTDNIKISTEPSTPKPFAGFDTPRGDGISNSPPDDFELPGSTADSSFSQLSPSQQKQATTPSLGQASAPTSGMLGGGSSGAGASFGQTPPLPPVPAAGKASKPMVGIPSFFKPVAQKEKQTHSQPSISADQGSNQMNGGMTLNDGNNPPFPQLQQNMPPPRKNPFVSSVTPAQSSAGQVHPMNGQQVSPSAPQAVVGQPFIGMPGGGSASFSQPPPSQNQQASVGQGQSMMEPTAAGMMKTTQFQKFAPPNEIPGRDSRPFFKPENNSDMNVGRAAFGEDLNVVLDANIAQSNTVPGTRGDINPSRIYYAKNTNSDEEQRRKQYWEEKGSDSMISGSLPLRPNSLTGMTGTVSSNLPSFSNSTAAYLLNATNRFTKATNGFESMPKTPYRRLEDMAPFSTYTDTAQTMAEDAARVEEEEDVWRAKMERTKRRLHDISAKRAEEEAALHSRMEQESIEAEVRRKEAQEKMLRKRESARIEALKEEEAKIQAKLEARRRGEESARRLREKNSREREEAMAAKAAADQQARFRGQESARRLREKNAQNLFQDQASKTLALEEARQRARLNAQEYGDLNVLVERFNATAWPSQQKRGMPASFGSAATSVSVPLGYNEAARAPASVPRSPASFTSSYVAMPNSPGFSSAQANNDAAIEASSSVASPIPSQVNSDSKSFISGTTTPTDSMTAGSTMEVSKNSATTWSPPQNAVHAATIAAPKASGETSHFSSSEQQSIIGSSNSAQGGMDVPGAGSSTMPQQAFGGNPQVGSKLGNPFGSPGPAEVGSTSPFDKVTSEGKPQSFGATNNPGAFGSMAQATSTRETVQEPATNPFGAANAFIESSPPPFGPGTSQPKATEASDPFGANTAKLPKPTGQTKTPFGNQSPGSMLSLGSGFSTSTPKTSETSNPSESKSSGSTPLFGAAAAIPKVAGANSPFETPNTGSTPPFGSNTASPKPVEKKEGIATAPFGTTNPGSISPQFGVDPPPPSKTGATKNPLDAGVFGSNIASSRPVEKNEGMPPAPFESTSQGSMAPPFGLAAKSKGAGISNPFGELGSNIAKPDLAANTKPGSPFGASRPLSTPSSGNTDAKPETGPSNPFGGFDANSAAPKPTETKDKTVSPFGFSGPGSMPSLSKDNPNNMKTGMSNPFGGFDPTSATASTPQPVKKAVDEKSPAIFGSTNPESMKSSGAVTSGNPPALETNTPFGSVGSTAAPGNTSGPTNKSSEGMPTNPFGSSSPGTLSSFGSSASTKPKTVEANNPFDSFGSKNPPLASSGPQSQNSGATTPSTSFGTSRTPGTNSLTAGSNSPGNDSNLNPRQPTTLGGGVASSAKSEAASAARADEDKRDVPYHVRQTYSDWCEFYDIPFTKEGLTMFQKNFLLLEDYFNSTGVALEMDETADTVEMTI